MADKSPYTNNKRNRHSYVHFYPESWLAGVAGLPRIVQSVYFEVCLYNWDKAKPIPESLLKMTLSDLSTEQAAQIVQALLDSGKIERSECGGFFNSKAIEEAERAMRIWQAKVNGGKKRLLDVSSGSAQGILKDTSKTLKKSKTPKAKQKVSSSTPSAILEESMQDSSSTPKGDIEDSSILEDTSKIAGGVLDRTKNLELGKKKEADASFQKDQQQDFSIEGGREAFEATAALRQAQAQADAHKRDVQAGMVEITEIWNGLAVRHGWSQISKMTERRQALVAARITEHGREALAAALRKVPESDYLMGRTEHAVSKPAFDWLMDEDTCARLVEGFYHRAPDSPAVSEAKQAIQRQRSANFARYRNEEIGFEEFDRERARLDELERKAD